MTLYLAHLTDVKMLACAGATSWFVDEARVSVDALTINGQPRGY